ncbi:coiled-coil domain-containing protein 166 isoform X4 [Paramormyrops kingsleyae]|uniref:coiled-coil domain-containing protein 166 isoform X4 n=1 Tax=Paramormyrops kingsleyae TaxID=1676925 RepID=UPI003B971FAE
MRWLYDMQGLDPAKRPPDVPLRYNIRSMNWQAEYVFLKIVTLAKSVNLAANVKGTSLRSRSHCPHTDPQQEYVSFVSRKTEILQSAIEALKEQNRQEVERLRKQREAELQKHTEKVNELKRRILEKESEICHLKAEIAELSEFKNQHQQQQLGRISELQGQLEAMYGSHAVEVRVQMADCRNKKAEYEKQARQAVEVFTRAANREAVRSMMAQMQQVSQENQSLQGELQQLIQRTHALRSRRDQLQARRQQLLLEKEYAQVVRRQRARPEEGSDVPPGQ